MTRREFITLLGGAAVVWPFAARAQQRAMPLVGYLQSGAPGPSASYLAALRRALSETSYVEGQNLTIEYRWAEGNYDRLPALVLAGDKPADLPVQQPTKFELGVNLKAAEALGLTFPPNFVDRADEVIE